MSLDPTSTFQSFLDDAVAKGVAPGFQCVVFDRDKVVYNGVSGLAKAPSKDSPEGTPFQLNNVAWVGSCSKICISLIVLHIIERGLTKTGFTMSDLDSHEALIKVLPEFKHGSGSLVTKIIEGFEDELGPDGRRVMKLRDAKGRTTLRMLLTHTAGLGYHFNHPTLAELCWPSDGSVPHFGYFFLSGDIKDIEIPLLVEPGTAYSYGIAADWVGEFLVRATGKSLRQLYKDVIFEPLSIPSSEADVWISPALEKARAALHVRTPDNGFSQVPMHASTAYMAEDMPPKGKVVCAGGCFYTSLQAYATILRAVLNHDKRILSEESWRLAIKDDLKGRGIESPKQDWESPRPAMTNTVHEYAKSTTKDGAGVNLLQCQVATSPTVSGRPTGSFGWAGVANTYYFIDPVTGVGAVFGTQLLPFFDTKIVEMRDKFETLIYETLFPSTSSS